MARTLGYFIQYRRWKDKLRLSLLGSLLLLIIAAAPAYANGGSATNAQVTVNLRQVLSTLSPLAVGTNAAVWDGHFQDSQVPGLLRDAGVKVLRYPGGSTSDNFHWQTNTLDDGSNAGLNSFDEFMKGVKKVGATPIITINYGSGTPEEAAAWVRYANITKHYNIQYWDIGNELYGNGTYGALWETDKHALGPASYANNSLQFISAMKAVDPSIKIGLVLTAPGNWPDGQISDSSPQPWNDTVLPLACSSMDFASVHWYAQGPTGESDAGLLAAPTNGESTSVSFTPSIPEMVSTLNSKISQYCGKHAKAVKTMITETNSVSFNPGKQTTNLVNALFLAENYMNWLKNGVMNVDWWDVHNSIVTWGNLDPSLYGTNNFGEYGLLSVGDPGEPPAETPFPTYYGLQMVSKVVSSNGQIVAASSNQSLIQAFAVRQRNGSIALLLINTDPSVSYRVRFAGLNCGGFGSATVYFYGQNSTSVSVSHKHGRDVSSQVIPPYSLTAIVLR